MCAISGEATQEAALEGMLRKVQEKWTGVELTVKQYKEAKDAYILGSVEDVQTVLEDSLAMMSTICSSRFVAGTAITVKATSLITTIVFTVIIVNNK